MSESTDLVTLDPEGAPAGELVPAGDQHPVVAEEHSHPGPRQYVLIALVLVILTAVEVATSYLEGHVNANLIIVALGIMAAVKFFLVAAWYMHMKQDSAVFRRLFLTGLILATIVYGILMLFFSSTVLKS
ncbi:MAG TPA: cytochrome C oxidase subunit IV family protein [Acidimicrobiia bacterium]|jgi:cytochrome c oxidase subunit 4|nr:cytochrome C oxidase subunit IV family protein [Acidimicrobiia bacterium]